MNGNSILISAIIFSLLIVLLGISFTRQMKSLRIEIDHSKETMENYIRTIEDQKIRLEVMFELSRGFLQAENERGIIDLVLIQAMRITGAAGVSFVPLDERGQPMGSIRQGDFPFPLPDAWLEYLATPSVRQQCNECKNYGDIMKICPLLKGPFAQVIGLYCLPLRRGDQDLGILNLYLSKVEKINRDTDEFLKSIIEEAALAITDMRSRKREIATINELQSIWHKSDLRGLLNDLISDLRIILEADFVLLAVTGHGIDPLRGDIFPDQLLSVGVSGSREKWYPVYRIMAKIYISENQEIVIPGKELNILDDSILALQLGAENQQPVGVIAVGKHGGDSFSESQRSILKTIAMQVALLVENTQRLADMQFRAMIEERIRLARELHDGLAQTLGFLKLQNAQMQSSLERGDFDRLQHLLKISYSALAEAYQDTRESIDGLRIIGVKDGSDKLRLCELANQVVHEFQDNGMEATVEVKIASQEQIEKLLPEVIAQIIRILQEALSNIRKHSSAQNVGINFYDDQNDLIMEIKDDGTGFAAEDVLDLSKHGLRGMRERAELIGADFQVISRPGEGTRILVRYPLSEQSKMEV